MNSQPYGRPRSSLSEVAADYVPGLVSVIIPCYNAEPFVAEAIESALSQTYGEIEVLVVDDGSTDNSLDVIGQYEDRVTLLSGPNRGACAARNTGLQHSHGEFIQFLDADDTLEPSAIAARLVAFTADVDLVFGDLIHIGEDGSHIPWYVSQHPKRLWESVGMINYIFINNIYTLEPLHRRSAACSVGGFDESIPRGQEPDFHLRLYLAGHRFAYREGVVGCFRQHDSPTRVGRSGWWTEDPERYISLAYHWVRLVSESSCDASSERFRRTMAAMLCGHAVQLYAAKEQALARRHHDALLDLYPGFLPHGAAGRVSQAMGLWTAIRVGGLRARIRERLSSRQSWQRT